MTPCTRGEAASTSRKSPRYGKLPSEKHCYSSPSSSASSHDDVPSSVSPRGYLESSPTLYTALCQLPPQLTPLSGPGHGFETRKREDGRAPSPRLVSMEGCPCPSWVV